MSKISLKSIVEEINGTPEQLVSDEKIKETLITNIARTVDNLMSTNRQNEPMWNALNSISDEEMANIADANYEKFKNVKNAAFINPMSSYQDLKKLVAFKAKGNVKLAAGEDTSEKPEPAEKPKIKEEAKPNTVKLDINIPEDDGMYKVQNPNGLDSVVYVNIGTDEGGTTSHNVLLVDKHPDGSQLAEIQEKGFKKVSKQQRNDILNTKDSSNIDQRAISAGSDIESVSLEEESKNIDSLYPLGMDDVDAISDKTNSKLDKTISGVKNSGSTGRYLRGLVTNRGGLMSSVAVSNNNNNSYVDINNIWSAFGVYHSLTRRQAEDSLLIYFPEDITNPAAMQLYKDDLVKTVIGGMADSILSHLVYSIGRLLVPGNGKSPVYSSKLPKRVADVISSMVYPEGYKLFSKPNPEYGVYEKSNGDIPAKSYRGNRYLQLNYDNIISNIDKSALTYDDISDWLSNGYDAKVVAMIRNTISEKPDNIILNDAKSITNFVYLSQEGINRMLGTKFVDAGSDDDAKTNMGSSISSHNSKSYTNAAVDEIIVKNIRVSFDDNDNDGNQDVVRTSKTYSPTDDRLTTRGKIQKWVLENKRSNEPEYDAANHSEWLGVVKSYYRTLSDSSQSDDIFVGDKKLIPNFNNFMQISRQSSFVRECLEHSFSELNQAKTPSRNFSYGGEVTMIPSEDAPVAADTATSTAGQSDDMDDLDDMIDYSNDDFLSSGDDKLSMADAEDSFDYLDDEEWDD